MARFIVDLNEEWGMTVVMIEHDMGVVMDLSHRLDGARLRPQDCRRPAGRDQGEHGRAARLSRRGARRSRRPIRQWRPRNDIGTLRARGRKRHAAQAAALQRAPPRNRRRAAGEGTRPVEVLHLVGLPRAHQAVGAGAAQPRRRPGRYRRHHRRLEARLDRGRHRHPRRCAPRASVSTRTGWKRRSAISSPMPRPRSSSPRTRSRSTRCCASRPASRRCRRSSIAIRAACASTPIPGSSSATRCSRPPARPLPPSRRCGTASSSRPPARTSPCSARPPAPPPIRSSPASPRAGSSRTSPPIASCSISAPTTSTSRCCRWVGSASSSRRSISRWCAATSSTSSRNPTRS